MCWAISTALWAGPAPRNLQCRAAAERSLGTAAKRARQPRCALPHRSHSLGCHKPCCSMGAGGLPQTRLPGCTGLLSSAPGRVLRPGLKLMRRSTRSKAALSCSTLPLRHKYSSSPAPHSLARVPPARITDKSQQLFREVFRKRFAKILMHPF